MLNWHPWRMLYRQNLIIFFKWKRCFNCLVPFFFQKTQPVVLSVKIFWLQTKFKIQLFCIQIVILFLCHWLCFNNLERMKDSGALGWHLHLRVHPRIWPKSVRIFSSHLQQKMESKNWFLFVHLHQWMRIVVQKQTQTETETKSSWILCLRGRRPHRGWKRLVTFFVPQQQSVRSFK